MSALSPDEVELIREEERVRAQVRLEIAHEQRRPTRRALFAKTLALWFVLVVVLLGLWRVFAPEQAREAPAATRP